MESFPYRDVRRVARPEQVGATMVGSEVTATVADISGDVAIRASGSRLDLAGVRLIGRSAAVVCPRRSNFIFSLSWIESPHRNGSVHEYVEVSPDDPL